MKKAGKILGVLIAIIVMVSAWSPAEAAFAANPNLTVDVSHTYQTIDGMGMNINVNSWDNGTLKPALDMLVDINSASIFRAVRDPMDWVSSESLIPLLHNLDAATLQQVYEARKMQDIWNTIGYLNQKGIRGDKIILNFQGWVAPWMGPGGTKSTITPGKEPALATMIASLVYYGRRVKNVDFTLLAPLNEPGATGVDGPHVEPDQYGTIMNLLVSELDYMGLSEIRLVIPDTISGKTAEYMSSAMAYSAVASRIAHLGFHRYGELTQGELDSYATFNNWITEGADREDGVDPDMGETIKDEWNFSRNCGDLILGELKAGWNAYLIWDGYSSYYEIYTLDELSGWGLLSYNPSTSVYAPRQRFYVNSQINRFVRPGMVRRDVSNLASGISNTVTFYNQSTGQLSIVGHNTASSSLTINGQLLNVPAAINSLTLYETNQSMSLQLQPDVAVTAGAFSFTVPADTFFSLTNIPVNNQTPVAVNDTYSVQQNTTLAVAQPGVLANDTSADGSPLTAIPVDDVSHGTLALNSDGSFTYTPGADYISNDSFTYKANDGQADSNIATVIITVTAVNAPPAAVNDAYSTNQGTTLTVNTPGVLNNDSDAEGDILTAALVNSVSHGVLTLNTNGGFTYTPTGGYSGTDTFTYKANDGQADSNTATVTIQVNAQATPSGSSLSFGGNDYVTFGDLDLTGSFTIEFWMKATSRTGWASVLMKNSDYGLEFDPQGRLSTSIYNGSTWDGYIYYAGITTGQWHHIAMVWDEVGNDLFLYVDGVMVGSDTNRGNHSANNNVLRLGAWTTGSEFFNGLLDEIRISNFVRYTSSFTPPTTLLEADSGTVALWHLDEGSGQTVNDSSGHGWNGVLGSSTSVQSSDPAWSSDSPVISSTNKPPVLFNDDIVTDEDTAITFDALSNDTDPDGDTLSIASVTQGSHGTVLINADGTIKYTPAANFHGTDSFTYTAADGKGGTSTASVNVIVNSINDIPVANDLALTMVEDSPIGVMLTANDIDGDTLTFTITSQPGGGTLSGTAPDLTYTPDTGYKGTDHFTFKVNDGQVDSNVATVTITVNAVNHIPIAENDTYAVNEDEVLTVASPGILSNDSDGDNDPLTVVKVSDPAHGSLVLNSNGSFTYTPNANFNGNDSFTYKANDNQADSGIATVSITVNPVNDPPAAVNDAYSTNQGTTLTVNAPGVLGNDSDIEGSGLTAVLATDASHGVLTLNPNGGFTYIPTGGYSGTDTFTYRANDGQLASNIATVTIQVNAQATPSGSSLSFGGNDYVTFGDLDLTGSFTIEFWMKANSRTGWASVLMKNSDYGLEFDPQGRLSTSIYNGSTWDGYIYYDGITTGQWHHIAMVWDEVGNDLYLYVDGVMVGSDTNRGNHSANNNVLRLGAWTTRSEFFTGLIDEVRISNFVRYTSNFTPPTTLLQSDSGTVALWHLDEGSGQRVNDSSGHGWNGVLGSSTSVQSSDPAWSSDTPIK